jgi:hypothetical protein
MIVFLLPHHALDPRFRYCLERSPGSSSADGAETDRSGEAEPGFFGRCARKLKAMLLRLKWDYDHLVHGHEQIRLSRLLRQMKRTDELTIVVPAALGKANALEAVRGVIRAGLMRHRAYVSRNFLTGLIVQVILFIVVPTHFAAFLFLPVILYYGISRFIEDRLSERDMKFLLEVRLATDNTDHQFREDSLLTRLQDLFEQSSRPDQAYQEAIRFLDGLDEKMDDQTTPAHTLAYHYYRDIGQLDPYERFQDRARKKIVESVKALGRELKHLILWPIRKLRRRKHEPAAATPDTPEPAPAAPKP